MTRRARISRLSLLALPLLAAASLRADSGPQHRVRQSVPVKMGTSGGSSIDASRSYCCGGTLGCLVRRDGVLSILSNNHVLGRTGLATSGEDDVQPGLIDSSCGSAGSNIVGDYAGNLVPLGSANVDAAITTARSTVVDTTGNILDIGVPCAGIQAPTVGLHVEKSGRTTGLTHGTIQAINVSVTVAYQQGCGTGRHFNVGYTNQIAITPGTFSAGGDSGSLIVSEDGTTNPVGLLFAGSSSSTIANPATAVASAFSAGGHTFQFVGNNCASPLPTFAPLAGISADDMEAAIKTKEGNESSLLARPGVLAVGVGVSDADAKQPAIVVWIDSSQPPGFAHVPKLVDGIPVKIIPTDPFVAR